MQADGQVFEGHVVSVGLLADLEDADDVGVGDRGGELGLPPEPLQVGGVAREQGTPSQSDLYR